MDTSDELTKIIAENAHRLRDCGDLVNRVALLHALAEVETGHGKRAGASLHEPSYCYNGFYYKGPNGSDLRDLSIPYGCLAHCSYSSWQLLFMAAYELGYRGDPCNLRDDMIAIEWVCAFINRRILDRYPRIRPEGVADAYNTGRPYDANKPDAYIAKFMEAYAQWSE